MVKCEECGFLALRSNATRQFIEANDEFRETGRPPEQLNAFSYPSCFRKVIDIQKLAMELPDSIWERDKRVLEIIGAERECELYIPWQMGDGPREHMERNPRDSQIAGETGVDVKPEAKNQVDERPNGVLLTGEQPPSTGSLQALYMPGPNSMARPYFVDFTTEGRDAVAINTGGPFQALRFVRPEEKIVHNVDLPIEIQCGSG